MLASTSRVSTTLCLFYAIDLLLQIHANYSFKFEIVPLVYLIYCPDILYLYLSL